MAIRLRRVDGVRVALCAAETDAMPGDVYLDDADHTALAAKFSQDFGSSFGTAGILPAYPVEWAAMDGEKLRDAETELLRWLGDPAAPVDVLAALRDRVAAAGSQRAWARACNISAPYVSDVLNGRRQPGPAILRALGLEAIETRSTVYIRKCDV